MTNYRAWDHKDWAAAGLKDFGDFSDRIEYVNQEEVYADSLRGEWWYADDETLTVYYGSFGNDHSPGASSYTFAETFPDDPEGYRKAVAEWEAKPEYLDEDDEDDLIECEGCGEMVEDVDDEGYCEDCEEDMEDEEDEPNMVNGYAHEYPDEDSKPDDMRLIMHVVRGDEMLDHYRMIDGSPHAVFRCVDGLYRAQTCVSLGLYPEPWEVRP